MTVISPCGLRANLEKELMICAPGDLIELRLKPTISLDDSAARWLTRFGPSKPAVAAPSPLSPFNGHVCKIRLQS